MSAATTPYSHYTLLADGEVIEPNADFGTVPGPAVMAMKVWAEHGEQAADMFVAFANTVAFKIAEGIELYETEPEKAPEDRPFGYDIQFTPYEGEWPE